MTSCLDLHDLVSKYRPGITESVGANMEEAAAICFDNQGHSSVVCLTVTGDFRETYTVSFKKVTEQMKLSWGDLQVATEYGAYGIAILIIDDKTDLTVIERSRKGTGFDFWLGTKSTPGAYFQNKARLEVSGILHDSDSEIDKRVKIKLNQVSRSDGLLPAYITVIEFSGPKAKVVKK